ncbi:MAG: 50S ribosomal protein L18 [Candidatus Woesearchaeota archaeon]|nr:MAG: 50S ribosomal protein L18 [Candidatus Woesearchaeota archaeon]
MKFVPYKRKREGRTNYKKRLKLLVSGSLRLVVRKTNKHLIVQLVRYNDSGDNVLVTVTSNELKKLGWTFSTSNIPAAYLTGLLAAKKSVSKGFNSAIVDIGLQTPSSGSRIFAAVKGAIDGGLDITCSEDAFPKEERLNGSHISESVANLFDTIKNKIMKEK